jgi:hypothetical protein
MHHSHATITQTVPDTNVLQAVHISKRASCNVVDKVDKPMTPNLRIATTASAHSVAGGFPSSVDRRIRAFLNGESHGEDVLGALYGSVADEPIPERLRALLKP